MSDYRPVLVHDVGRKVVVVRRYDGDGVELLVHAVHVRTEVGELGEVQGVRGPVLRKNGRDK